MNSPSVQGIVIAAFELGALVGALSCLDLGDRLGRRMTVWLGMCFMLLGGSLQCSAWRVGQLLTGRIISGIGLGLQVGQGVRSRGRTDADDTWQVATVPAWQSETAKPHSRGRWGEHFSRPRYSHVLTIYQ